jgi:hypothetical protein
METTRFLPYTPGQILLLPPDLRDWLEEGHLAYFILDVVETLDLSEIYASYDGSRGGRPGFNPRLLVGLLVYGRICLPPLSHHFPGYPAGGMSTVTSKSAVGGTPEPKGTTGEASERTAAPPSYRFGNSTTIRKEMAYGTR